MVAKISGGSAGSCQGLAEYLEKEQQGQWFDVRRDDLQASQVVQHIDANKRNLGQQDTKFYQVIISPSERELAHIGNDAEKLKAYTRDVMDGYAQNFGKGIKSEDLVWYAKIEYNRHYSHQDRPVQTGEVERGQPKAGHTMHVHVIVSRTENLDRFRESQQAGTLDRKNPLKLSPATNHRATAKGAVRGGFDRVGFKVATEQQFDRRFNYERPLQETFSYANTMAHGDQAQRLAARQALRQQEQASRQGQEARQQQRPQQPLTVMPTPEGTSTRQVKPVEPLTPIEARPTLDDAKKDLMRTLLEKIDETPQQSQRLRPGGLHL